MENNKEQKIKKARGRHPMPANEKSTERLNLRLTKAEMKTLNDRLSIGSNFSTLSDLAKNIIFNRKIVVYTRDKDLDITLSEVNKLRNEMNAIGKNFNQIAKRINTYEDQFLYKKEFVDIEKNFEQFLKIQKELAYKFDLLAEKWLQK
ncbi:plasmid mobilization relaxosome protein MobC [bacterium]|nr:MAG: plasmid mobilization relaxosome protein MobC [bacterium]